MTASRPAVSAIVTCYNSAATISRAIDSIRVQSMPDLEIVVVDDASVDDTTSIVDAIPDPRIRLIRNETNRGIGGAKNAGVAASRGRHIAFLDSDDTWVPEKLAVQMQALARHDSGAPLSFAAFWVHRSGSNTTVLRCPHRYSTWLSSLLMGETFSLGSTLLATRECFDTVGPFRESLRRLQDRDWTLRYLRQWDEFVFVPQPLAHIYNSGWPKAETVTRSVNALYEEHREFLNARDPALDRLFRESLNFEIAVAEYREGRKVTALKQFAAVLMSRPAYAGYLVRRATRKLSERDFD
jgi:glycosyltransferase involved in cell wall biosynthesis